MDIENELNEADQAESGTDNDAAARIPSGPGEKLRAARLAKGYELNVIAAETRIRERHLQALESEAFEQLPARMYAIGFARNYARAVGLDEAEIADAVRERMIDESERREGIAGGMEPGDPAKLPSAGLAWFGGFAAIILAAGVYTFYNTYYAGGGGIGSLLASGEDAADEPGDMAAADGDTSAAISPDGQVVFTALDDEIWVRFFVEGGDVLFEKTMMKGETFEVPKNIANVQLNTGRPQFLEITIDGQSVPKLAEEQVTLVEPVTALALLTRFAPEPSNAPIPAPDGGQAAATNSVNAGPAARAVLRPVNSPAPQAASVNPPASGIAAPTGQNAPEPQAPLTGASPSDAVAEQVSRPASALPSAPTSLPAATPAPAETTPRPSEAEPPAGA